MIISYLNPQLDPRNYNSYSKYPEGISKCERERLKLCDQYFKSINHTYLKISDVKNIDGSKMFLALIDYEDSKIFRQNNHFLYTLFPLSTTIGNIDGNIYDFNHNMFLDLDKYYINYVIRFSDIMSDDKWEFIETKENKKVELFVKHEYNGTNINGRKNVIPDKFILCQMGMNVNKHKWFDETATEKVLKLK